MHVDMMHCCGVAEAYYVSHDTNGDISFQTFISDTTHNRSRKRFGCFGLLIITQAGTMDEYGERFVAYITQHKLGPVTQLPTFTNPNTQRPIKTFCWQVDWKAVKDHAVAKHMRLGCCTAWPDMDAISTAIFRVNQAEVAETQRMVQEAANALPQGMPAVPPPQAAAPIPAAGVGLG